MPTRRLHLNTALLAKADSRTIEGVSIPSDESVNMSEFGFNKPVMFAADSITFDRENVPLLAYHDPTRPVGRLQLHQWDESGWHTQFKVSATRAGDDILTLAADGVLGLSIGIDIPAESDIEETSEGYIIHRANCFEVSVTPTPRFAGAVIDKVKLSKEVGIMTEESPKETVELASGDLTVNFNDTLADTATKVNDAVAAEAPADQTATQSKMSWDRPVAQPIARTTARLEREMPYPHLFGGKSKGYSFIRDLAMQRGVVTPGRNEGGFNERLEALRFAVTTADIAPTEATTDNSLTVTPSDPKNPLSGIITTRSLPADGGQPFYVLHRDNSGDTNLSNPHVEGVEPTLGDIGGWTRKLVESAAVSGKVAVTREAALANTSPDMEALVFQRMDQARARAIEAAVAKALKDETLPAGQVKTLGGSNAGDEFTAIMLDLMYTTDGGDRYTTAMVNRQLFGDLVNSKDSAGRPLYPIQGPTNANGTTAPGLKSVNVAGVNIYPVSGLQDGGYLLDPSSAISWLGPVLDFTFDYEVAWIRLAHYQSQAFSVVDNSGIIRLTYSAT